MTIVFTFIPGGNSRTTNSHTSKWSSPNRSQNLTSLWSWVSSQVVLWYGLGYNCWHANQIIDIKKQPDWLHSSWLHKYWMLLTIVEMWNRHSVSREFSNYRASVYITYTGSYGWCKTMLLLCQIQYNSIVHHVLDTKFDALIEMYIALQMEMVQ